MEQTMVVIVVIVVLEIVALAQMYAAYCRKQDEVMLMNAGNDTSERMKGLSR
jgi:hypothetical protein